MKKLLETPAPSPFSGYKVYVSKLKRLVQESYRATDWDVRVDAALNGQASVELRLVAPLEARRKFGTFFTGTDLGAKLIACGSKFSNTSIFYDPTCGMGDLLIAAARQLPRYKTLRETLYYWGRQLTGTDLHQEFIDGARTRLVLLARQLHKSDEPLQQSDAAFFPYIRVADGSKQHALFARATHLLLNPPFGQVDASPGCKWTSGRFTEAAEFVITALERSTSGSEMLAILPEVLRSGSFSEQWRKRVNELAEIRLIEPYGIFDSSADVDVFLLRLIRRDSEALNGVHQWFPTTQTISNTVADLFEVHVGRVVPHRDPEEGTEHPYIHARCVPPWTVMHEFSEFRRHGGSPYAPPFVVIRRTSRPGDEYRATATVISGKKPVFVENHLIVCKPKDDKIKACKMLMARLKKSEVSDFLDARIRCRHLTVGAVKEIPL